jgi:large subunit ribosomal protein L17
MRHKKGYNKLSKPTDQRMAMLKSMSVALLKHNRIEITEPRAKELRKFVDGIITLVKKGDLQSRRRVISTLLNEKELVKNIYATSARFNARKGGYTRIIRTGVRRGDAAQMVLIELVDAGINA